MVGTDPARRSRWAILIVLIHGANHGANHGGWCWQRAVSLLVAQCHKVHAPTLTNARRC